MAQSESDAPRVSGWAVGGVVFAASMMILVGCFQAINGLVAIVNDDFYVQAQHYTFHLDITAWGWIHLIIGILMVVAGWALFAGRAWAVIFAIVLAMLSAVDNFFFLPYYSFAVILIIAIDIWIIWALTRPGVIRD